MSNAIWCSVSHADNVSHPEGGSTDSDICDKNSDWGFNIKY